MSSAKSLQRALMNGRRSLIVTGKSNGPRTEHWGTLYLRDRTLDTCRCVMQCHAVR